MKKRIITGLLGGTFVLALTAGTVQAKTYGYDLGTEYGGAILYITEDSVSDLCEPETEGISTETGNEEDLCELSEEERKKLEDWHREQMREQVAYLESYGVTYDADTDRILYQGKTVRWLIDRQIDNTYMALQMPEGEIDLYTERSEDFRLTGVRIASQEEYDERTEEEGKPVRAEQAAEVIKDSLAEDAWSGSKAEETTVAEDVLEEAISPGQSENEPVDFAYEATAEATVAMESGTLTEEEREEQERRMREYEQAGILYDEKTGCFLWNHKPIHYLIDENGGISTNGSEEAIKNKIYVIVKRNDDGTIKEAKQVTVEEAVSEQILMKEKE